MNLNKRKGNAKNWLHGIKPPPPVLTPTRIYREGKYTVRVFETAYAEGACFPPVTPAKHMQMEVL